MAKKVSAGKTIFKIACATGGAVLASGVGLPWLGAMAGSCLPKVLEGSLGFLVSAVEDDKKQEVLASLLQKPIEQLASLGIEFTGGRIDDFFKSHFEAKESELNFDLPRAVVKVWEEALNKMLRAERDTSTLGLNRDDEFEKARKELLTFWRQKLQKAQSDNDLLKEFFGEKPDYFLDVEKGKMSFIDALPEQKEVEIFFWNRIEESFTNWATIKEKFPEDWANSIHQSLRDELKQNLFDDFSSVLKENLKENERAWKSFEFASSLQTVSMLQSLASNIDQIKDDTSNIKNDLAELNTVLPLIMRSILTRFDALENTVKEFFISNQNINELLIDFRKDVSEKLSEIGKDLTETKDYAKQAAENTEKLLKKSGYGETSSTEEPKRQVTISLNKAPEYQELLDRQKELEKHLSYIPEDDFKERLETSEKINRQKEVIKEYVQGILKLAEQLSQSQINSDRLRRAKEFFDDGKFAEARAVFETELEQMRDEQSHLLKEREKFETDTLLKLKNNAEEFLVFALSTQTDYSNPNRFEKTNEYFEDSIKSFKNKDNLRNYAYFLQNHSFLANAHFYYHEILDHFFDDLFDWEYGLILGNLGIVHTEFTSSGHLGINNFKKALEVWNRINEKTPSNNMQLQIAATLNLMGSWYIRMNDFDSALQNTEEALRIFRQINEISSGKYPFEIARQLRNSGLCNKALDKFKKAEEQLQEALAICGQVKKGNRQENKCLLSNIYGDLAVLHEKQNNYKLARKYYLASLKILRELVDLNIYSYLPDLALVLHNLADHFISENNFDEALKYSEEAHDIYHRFNVVNSDAYLDKICSSHTQLGRLYNGIKNFERASHYFDKAIVEIRNLVEIDSKRYSHDLGLTLVNYAELKREQKDLENSLTYFNEALEVYEGLAKSNPKIYLRWLALTSLNLGILYDDLRNLEKAISFQKKALKIYRKLALENPNVYLPQVASCLGNLGNPYLVIAKDYKKALKHYEEAFTILEPFAKSNPQENLYYFSRILRNLGVVYHNQSQYDKALKKFAEALKISKNLSNKNQYYLKDVAEIYEQLAGTFDEKKEFANSIRNAKQALEIYENLAEENPIVYLTEVAKLNYFIGATYREKGDNEFAKEEFKQTLESYQKVLRLSKNREKTIEYAVEGFCYSLKIQHCSLMIKGKLEDELDHYGSEFKAVLESFGLNDSGIAQMATQKIRQIFHPI